MSKWRLTHVRDDRGNRVRVRPKDGDRRRDVAIARAKLEPGFLYFRLAMLTAVFIAVTVLAACIALGAIELLTPTTHLPLSYELAPVVSILAVIVVTVVGFGRAFEDRVVCRAGFCPACGHDLTGTPADPDATTPCPECGAAWKLPPAPTDE